MFKNRNWFGVNWGRPKNPHSLDQLKYLYNVLTKNHVVSENNRGLLVETLRSIAEILIWGDQNDSSVFDFFLEKNMLSYFLKIMVQKSGGSSYVCVQLLQTLNILFENIRNETSIYYLLSNNHVNSIIVHKFDFSDEEVMAYYISFLKTLSLKLNSHTIHFFYNENTKDFPLYTEAIKFFNHPESMVRIAVRTLTLNVYRIQDDSMLRFIRDRTAAPYFSNLVWFIGKHVLELDSCVKNGADFQVQQKLDALVAEHLDSLHYLNDILCLNIPDLNDVLTEHLLHKLLIPLYIYSLAKSSGQFLTPSKEQVQNIETITKKLSAVLRFKNFETPEEEAKPSISVVVALFLLTQVFLIITHGPIVQALALILLQCDKRVLDDQEGCALEFTTCGRKAMKFEFAKPAISLEKALDASKNKTKESEGSFCEDDPGLTFSPPMKAESGKVNQEIADDAPISDQLVNFGACISSNITDEEKQQLLGLSHISDGRTSFERQLESEYKDVSKKTFLKIILDALDCSDDDYKALFALCLLYAMSNNGGVNPELLDQLLKPISVAVKEIPSQNQSQLPDGCPDQEMATESATRRISYNTILTENLMSIIHQSCISESKVRLVTLELTTMLCKMAAGSNPQARIRSAADASRLRSAELLKTYLDSDIFIDIFEDEYANMSKGPLNVERLCMDSTVVLPPTRNPMSGIPFNKRLPNEQVEKTRHAIRTFLLIRRLYLQLSNLEETQLPLTNSMAFHQVGDVLDLNESDLISCQVSQKDGTWQHRFLTVDGVQVTLVEPDRQRMGWGVAKLVASLQHLEIEAGNDDNRSLLVSLTKAGSNELLMRATLRFDDQIRCYSAKQRLMKGRTKARQRKMHQIARLLDISVNVPILSVNRPRPPLPVCHPGHAKRNSLGDEDSRRRPSPHYMRNGVIVYRERKSSQTSRSSSRSRESSPRPRLEDIPLELIPPGASIEASTSSASTPSPKTVNQKGSSAETSFMTPERSIVKSKRTIEII